MINNEPITDTVRVALARAVERLGEQGVPEARLDAELLLAETLGMERSRLILEPGRVLSGKESETFEAMLRRRGAREPVQYILGRQEFWSLDFPVDPRVLIPRPETELVVEAALEVWRGRGGEPILVDMGCGSGNISVALARELPSARLVAVDASREAAEVTRAAAARHGVAGQVMTLCADLFSACGAGFRADGIVSNPPYVDSAELDRLQPEVGRYEPRLALDGGPGGLEVINLILEEAPAFLIPGGRLIFEAGWDQAARIGDLVRADGRYASHEVRQDLAGHERVHILGRI